ncbi:MAG: hypothetical protein OXF02_01040 [Simkaniaceae bacterium]|nr:hypothetical protein [Simkaniaceae bacterium]
MEPSTLHLGRTSMTCGSFPAVAGGRRARMVRTNDPVITSPTVRKTEVVRRALLSGMCGVERRRIGTAGPVPTASRSGVVLKVVDVAGKRFKR